MYIYVYVFSNHQMLFYESLPLSGRRLCTKVYLEACACNTLPSYKGQGIAAKPDNNSHGKKKTNKASHERVSLPDPS